MPLPETPATNTYMGDVVYERAEALKEAVNHAREALCIRLDGPQEPHYKEAADYKEAVSAAEDAWRDFQVAAALAQRRIEQKEGA